MANVKNGRMFSAEFNKATEVNSKTRLLAQTPNEPVEYVDLEQVAEVVNEGMRGGKPHRAVGRAKTTNKSGCLRVSFFWIFYSDYNVLEMGEKGEWALVGSRSPQYLWILSRTPTLPDATVDYIVEQAAKRGYNVKNLIFDR